MTIIKNKLSPNIFITQDPTPNIESSNTRLLNKSDLYAETSFLQAPEYASLFHIDNLSKNGESLFNIPIKTIRRNNTFFLSLFLYPYIIPFFIISFSLLFGTQNFTFEICLFYLLSSVMATFGSIYFKHDIYLTVKNPSTLNSVKVPLLWILYHNLTFKSENHKKLWLLEHIFIGSYNKTSFFYYKELTPHLKKLIAEAQKTLDNSFSNN